MAAAVAPSEIDPGRGTAGPPLGDPQSGGAGAPVSAATDRPGGAQPLANRCYAVEVQTGTWPNAGTDTSVNLRIIGSSGESPWLNLDLEDYDDREAGNVDVYKCWNLPDLGTLTAA